MSLLNDCPDCHKVELPECGESITIKAALEPSTDYHYFIKDHFGAVKSNVVTTDINGNFIIDNDIFPPGYFVKGMGNFELTVKKMQEDCGPETLTFCGTSYKCLLFSFQDITHFASTGGGDEGYFETDEYIIIY